MVPGGTAILPAAGRGTQSGAAPRPIGLPEPRPGLLPLFALGRGMFTEIRWIGNVRRD